MEQATAGSMSTCLGVCCDTRESYNISVSLVHVTELSSDVFREEKNVDLDTIATSKIIVIGQVVRGCEAGQQKKGLTLPGIGKEASVTLT